jgi:hypothetical protein
VPVLRVADQQAGDLPDLDVAVAVRCLEPLERVPRPALRMRAADLVSFLSRWDGTMHSRLHRYTTNQRTARWLLMTRDRVDRDTYTLTQEFLSQMLGVRRATVSGIAAEFQAAGLIAYHRGTMSITDPACLESLTCECYRVIQDEYDQLLDAE